jgi:hypothetical protein
MKIQETFIQIHNVKRNATFKNKRKYLGCNNKNINLHNNNRNNLESLAILILMFILLSYEKPRVRNAVCLIYPLTYIIIN